MSVPEDLKYHSPIFNKRGETLVWLLLISLSVLIRYAISIHPYSGHAKPPMFGDYEAQRHWMEITTKLPTSEWYFNTTNNDLQYWGLDYPPLTAYSSWLFGKIGEKVEPESMALYTSRGYESKSSKLFMRSTVIVSDLLIWLPAVLFFVQTFYKEQSLLKRSIAFIFISMQPSLLLIDHGHFQYNGISLGFALFGITFILRNQQLLASLFFVLSLNYKQMSLYYSPAFFFYLLFTNLSFSNIFKSILNIAKIGIVVITTFIICWIPFLSLEQASQVLFRLFPVARGLFEDKVANFWCVASTVINFKTKFSPEQLLKLCTLTTLAAISIIVYPLIKKCWSANLKSNWKVVMYRSQQLMFIYSLIISAFAFFLFSFQVHEKTILLPLLPVSLLVLESGYITIILMLVSHYLFEFIEPPVHLPALFHLLVASISFGYFCLTVLGPARCLSKKCVPKNARCSSPPTKPRCRPDYNLVTFISDPN
ncbi:glycosyltransferase [Heterostelium album PN500]|uniref:Alpha-1,3-glucosyltransferase n=1 Tax=Heterostelium pallidum (strain ATCC 26659 / Pp 5 / PN500) TaxID=670386 RepID=D3BP67_HETP5|nr:glycosyltransferase [Heterostelium album PN500]EFA77077.1 glycosyltransferase [Heterostelium album PN500]|eukprot:XP_020429206.1 glycosyltransferase [Heterostelium album PN500]